MAPERAPAFQFYPKDWLTDATLGVMSYTEHGMYMALMCHCWLERSLPNDPAELAKLLKMPSARFARIWAGPLHRCFTIRDDGRLVQKRLETEREKQDEYRRRQSDKGKASGRARNEPRFNHGSTGVQPGEVVTRFNRT